MIGKRVVVSPNQVPTMRGYLGCRRGEIVESGVIGEGVTQCGTYTVKLDKVKGTGQRNGTVSVPHTWLVSEETFDNWVNNGGFDPYTQSPPDYTPWKNCAGYRD